MKYPMPTLCHRPIKTKAAMVAIFGFTFLRVSGRKIYCMIKPDIDMCQRCQKSLIPTAFHGALKFWGILYPETFELISPMSDCPQNATNSVRNRNTGLSNAPLKGHPRDKTDSLVKI